MKCSIVIRYVFTCGIDRTLQPSQNIGREGGCVAAGMAAESFPFRSSCGLLSRHFTPSRHLSPPSPHTTETGCLPSSLPPLSPPDIQSGVDISFASTGIGIATSLPLSPLTAFDPFRGGDQRPSDDGRQIAATKCPLLPPNHTPHQVS